MNAITLELHPIIDLTDEQYYQLCRNNPDIKFERDREGRLIIVPPTGGNTGRRNADLTTDLSLWNREAKLGIVFDSSTQFRLPNNGARSPDAAWVKMERWEALTEEQQEKFPPICPDFVIELRSPSDRLAPLQAKMQEYLDSGLRLGWLIDPKHKQVEIYRQGQVMEVLQPANTLSGEDVLPGFVLFMLPPIDGASTREK